jgi:dTDP-4-amino-4,6-dideoxygalactose transaminase
MNGIKIPFLDIGATYRELKDELDEAYQRVMSSGWYLLGAELEKFESEWAAYCRAGHCAGVASGLDALTLALRALDVGPGDEVIVPSNTYIATWLAVSAVGAVIVPVEPDPQTYNITGEAVAAAVTSRTAAIMPVHLYGHPADVYGIQLVADRHGLPVVYDAAQAHGARVDGRSVGEFGTITAWSFYPGKNLGAFADAGAITTNDAALANRIKMLRNYGSVVKYENLELGVNSRMDELQAAFLSVKLCRLDEWNARRNRIAQIYLEQLHGTGLTLPSVGEGVTHAWHLFVIQSDSRDDLQKILSDDGIQTLIHYPIPPQRQVAYRDLASGSSVMTDLMAARVLSLPIGPQTGVSDAAVVAETLRRTVDITDASLSSSKGHDRNVS